MKHMKQMILQNKGYILADIVMIFLASLLSIFIPLQVKQLLESSSLGWDIFMLVLLFVGQVIMAMLSTYVMARLAEQYMLIFQKRVLSHVAELPINYFEQHKSGELTHRLITDLADIKRFISVQSVNLLSSSIIVVGSFIMLVLLDWQLTIVLFVSLVIVFILMIILSNISQKFSDSLKKTVGNLSGVMGEWFQQIRLLKFTGAEKEFNGKLSLLLEKHYHTSLRVHLIDALVQPLMVVVLIMTIIGIFVYGGLRIQAGTLSVGVLVAFLIYLFQLFTPFSQISLFFNDYAKVKVSIQYIEDLISEPTENYTTKNKIDAKQLAFNKLAFNQVGFGYYGEEFICQDLNLTFKKGEKIAIVGPSGAGKTTILSLIERFYPLKNGSITIDDTDISVIDLVSWRQQIAVVSQDTALLSATIYDNLMIGLAQEVSLNKIDEALKKANLLEDIEKLPQGIQTEIGERGVKLSGGQQQRLQIARAFLRNAPILIMDEATSNLDSQTEKEITDALTLLAKDCIAIFVAHRLATVRDADCIYFIENGKVTGRGKHEELQQTHTMYAEYVQKQML